MTALAVAALFLVVRAVVELVLVDPSRPETYRDDWGGPSYLGVVHAGPGIVVVGLAILALRRRRRRSDDGRTPRA